MKTGEILIDLVTTDGRDCGGEREITDYLEKWVDDLCRLSLDGKIAGILHTTNNSVADVVKDEGTETLYGQGYFYEELLGLKFKITPFSFFQTNSLGAEVLYERHVNTWEIQKTESFLICTVERERLPDSCAGS